MDFADPLAVRDEGHRPHDRDETEPSAGSAGARRSDDRPARRDEKPADDWGFAKEKRGMSTETKIGLTLVVLLLGTFGFVVWKKLQQRQGDIRPADFAEHPEARERRDARRNQDEERKSPPLSRADERVVHADAFDDPKHRHDETGWDAVQPVSRETPKADDPFAELNPENFRGRHESHRVQKPAPPEHCATDDPPFEDLFAVEDKPATTDQACEKEPTRDGFAEYEFADDFDFGEERHDRRKDDEWGSTRRNDPWAERTAREECPDDRTGREWDHEPGRLEIVGDPRIRQTRGEFPEADSRRQHADARGDWDQNDFEPIRRRENVAQKDPGWDDFETFEPIEPKAGRSDRRDDFGHEIDQLPPRRDDFGQRPARRDDFGPDQFEPTPVGRHEAYRRDADSSPNGAACEDAPTGTHVHEVTPGDSYWTISREAYGTAKYFSALAKFNEYRIADPKKMRPGMKVLCPPAAHLHQRYPKLCGPGEGAGGVTVAAESGFFVGPDGRPKYRVGEEDTLSDIAHVHLGRGSRWVQIYEMNRDRLRKPETLPIGTVLDLPADASSVRVVQTGRVYR